MANNLIKIPTTFPAGEVVALDVTAEDFLTRYANTHHEWIEGMVIKIPSQTRTHIRLMQYWGTLLNGYFELNPIGEALTGSFAMWLEHSFRTPDVIVILNDNPSEYTETRLKGAGDICVEIVSEESNARDYGEKLAEYEQAGVKEYWIVDPLRHTIYFHRLQVNQRYLPIAPTDDVYETPLLPKFRLSISTLWQDPLPNYFEVAAMVQDMLKDK